MRTIPILLATLALAACGRSESDAPKQRSGPSESRRSVSSELPKGVKPSAELMEMRRIAGVWRSSPGALPESPKNSVQIEIAFDSTFSMTLWGRDPKSGGEAVFARQAGRIGRTKEGIAGSTSNAGKGPLSRLAAWSASLDKNGMLVVVPSGTTTALPFRRVSN